MMFARRRWMARARLQSRVRLTAYQETFPSYRKGEPVPIARDDEGARRENDRPQTGPGHPIPDLDPGRRKRREKILAGVHAVEAIPTAAVSVLEALADPDVDLRAVAPKIEYDPGLTANLLRMVNSPYFGFHRKISSVREACIRLGIDKVRNLVIAAAVSPLARRPIKGYALPAGALWEHSVATAVATEKLSGILEIPPEPHTFTTAILHDIGKVVMGTFIEVNGDPILHLAKEQNVDFDDAERRVLGVDHAEVGAALLESWNLPHAIVDVVRWHHRPEEGPAGDRTLDIVHCADALSLMSGVGTGQDGLSYSISQEVTSRLGLTAEISERAICDTLTAMAEMRELFSLTSV
ncbi:MAG: HDOD domain-containing protein [Candidatus Eisenbacteria bacterium]|nr:HDOD domain-containing protein [Candidatus Eisenbacteria bacterium]